MIYAVICGVFIRSWSALLMVLWNNGVCSTQILDVWSLKKEYV